MKDEYFDSIESMTLLPHSFKRWGYVVLVLAIPFALGIGWVSKSMQPLEEYRLFWREWGLTLIHYFLAIGFSLIAFSKEKLEDEMIQALRFKSFVYGVYLFAVACLGFPLLSNLGNLMGGRPFHVKDIGGQIASLNLLLVSIIIVFRIRIFLEKKRA